MFPIASTAGTTNAAYSIMQGTKRASDLAFANNGDLSGMHNVEKQNSMGMVQDRALYKMHDVSYESDKALQDKNIKRTFSCFA